MQDLKFNDACQYSSGMAGYMSPIFCSQEGGFSVEGFEGGRENKTHASALYLAVGYLNEMVSKGKIGLDFSANSVRYIVKELDALSQTAPEAECYFRNCGVGPLDMLPGFQFGLTSSVLAAIDDGVSADWLMSKCPMFSSATCKVIIGVLYVLGDIPRTMSHKASAWPNKRWNARFMYPDIPLSFWYD
ncbi:hypothetical protein [Pseudomonas sp. BDPW]|uniref:hypothetical protein n=1 Tax=Pseudomonas sp. BDPW TaxID=2806612 RepID=UPI00193C32AE|nr:hypothetical protein [Pseudomonas sp. BDPW]MBM2598537.1 hypothetical protein [Pseudomonas sp. BDPW]